MNIAITHTEATTQKRGGPIPASVIVSCSCGMEHETCYDSVESVEALERALTSIIAAQHEAEGGCWGATA